MPRAVLAVLAVLALPTAAAARPPSPPPPVACGQTITHDVTLTRDLVDCPGDGLVIGADGITIRLAGHVVDGRAPRGCADPAPGGVGIANPGAHDRVTIAGGTVQQFDLGLAAGGETDGMSDSRVTGVRFVANRFGAVSLGSRNAADTARNRIDHDVVLDVHGCDDAAIELNTTQDNSIDHDVVVGGGIGILVCCGGDADDNVVAANAVSHTRGRGITVEVSGGTRVLGNAVTDAGEAGILVVGGRPDVRVEGNRVERSSATAIFVSGCPDCPGRDADPPSHVVVAGNRIDRAGNGILLFDTVDSVVRGNRVVGAGTYGDPDLLRIGLGLGDAARILVTGNTVTDGAHLGIVVGAPDAAGEGLRPVAGNVLEHNVAAANADGGIVVSPIARQTLLAHNRADRNGADGIAVLSPTTTLTANHADRNALFGIDAIAGVTDGGGNVARGNGSPAQCRGIACRPAGP